MIKKQWLSFAQEDYLTLLSLWEQELPLYRVICFYAQQYTEKILKGLLTEKNIAPPRIHDIIKLSKLCQRIDIQMPLSRDDQALYPLYALMQGIRPMPASYRTENHQRKMLK